MIRKVYKIVQFVYRSVLVAFELVNTGDNEYWRTNTEQ